MKTFGTLSTLCATIARKKASPEAKMIALTYRVFNMVLYQAQLSPWSLEQCRKLDIPVNKLLRYLTLNMRSISTKLLYMCKTQCGLGFNRLSDEIQIIAGDDTMVACLSIVGRAARFYGIIPVRGQAYTVGMTK